MSHITNIPTIGGSMHMNRLFRTALLIFMAMMLLFSFSGAADAVFAGGIGTQESPWQIANEGQLQQLQDNNHNVLMNAHFVLINDITLTQPWVPIGNETHPFSGTINGNNHTIHGLYINSPNQRNVGFFGVTYYYVTISNMRFESASVTGYRNVGIVAGSSIKTVFENIVVESSTVNGLSVDDTLGALYLGTGGLVGNANMSGFVNSHFSGTVSGNIATGGILGFASNVDIMASSVTGNVIGTRSVGGITGNMDLQGVRICNSHVFGNVSGTTIVGGISGNGWSGSIRNSSFTGNVSGIDTNIGGLTGSSLQIELRDSFATGNVTGFALVGGATGVLDGNATAYNITFSGTVTGSTHVGGLAGLNEGVINRGYASGTVTSSNPLTAGMNHGGLVGFQRGGSINNSGASNTVTGFNNAGGLVGQLTNRTVHTGQINNSYFTGTVIVNNLRGGGLVGLMNNGAVINNSHASGTVTGGSTIGGLAGEAINGIIYNSSASNHVITSSASGSTGGLVGFADFGTINRSHFAGDVSGANATGGLIGLAHGTTITDSFVTGNVTGANFVGGLVGSTDRPGVFAPTWIHIYRSHVTGAVTGNAEVGGLVGRLTPQSQIRYSYVTGNVSGGNLVGGLVGNSTAGHIWNSFAAGDVSGTTRVGGLVGGETSGLISTSFATGNVTGTAFVGGLVGHADLTLLAELFALNERVTGTSDTHLDIGSANGTFQNTVFHWAGANVGGNPELSPESQSVTSQQVWDTFPGGFWSTQGYVTGQWTRNNHDQFLLPVHVW